MKNTILIVEDNAMLRTHLNQLLSKQYKIYEAANLQAAREILQTTEIHLVLLDIKLPDGNGLSLIKSPELFVQPVFVVLSAVNDSKIGSEAIKLGAQEFILKEEFEQNEEIVLNTIANLLRLKHSEKLNYALTTENERRAVICIPNHPCYQAVYQQALAAAKAKLNILITGPTGSGKDMLVKYIHKSLMPQKPLISINCGAICDSLAESELFGHEQASFTGAEAARIGKIELADQGMLFLDELGNMPVTIQNKLLRVLEDHKVTRIGGRKEIDVDFLLICATNRNLEEAVKQQAFRSDLWYRINQVTLKMPALDEYPEVLVQFIHFFIQQFNKKYQINYQLKPEMLLELTSKPWPGGIRELKNTIQVLVAKAALANESVQIKKDPAESHLNRLDVWEKTLLQETLKFHNNQISETARFLRMPKQTLHSKLKKYELN